MFKKICKSMNSTFSRIKIKNVLCSSRPACVAFLLGENRVLRYETGPVVKVSGFSGNYPPESRQTDRQTSSSLIASSHLSLDSDSRRVSNRKHFGRNTGPTCPWARDIEEREGEKLLLFFFEKIVASVSL